MADTDAFEQLARLLPGPVRRLAEDMDGRLGDIFEHAQMLPEVEGLEHHGQARTPATQLPFVNGGQAAIPVRS